METENDVIDRIERSVDIEAGAESVYALVSRPGWWVNEDEVDPAPDLRREGDLHVLTHPAWGEFRIRVEEEQPPRYVAFRWIDDAATGAGTTVEFRIEDRTGGGVTLTVVESGFSTLAKDRAAIADHVRENTQGWEAELAAARRFVANA